MSSILCYKRDAIKNPPKDERVVPLTRSSGGVSQAYFDQEDRIWRHEIIDHQIHDAVSWLEVTDIPAMSVESVFSVHDYEYQRGREFFAKQILSEIDAGSTIQEIAKICLGEIRRCFRKEIDEERKKAGLPPVDWSKVP